MRRIAVNIKLVIEHYIVKRAEKLYEFSMFKVFGNITFTLVMRYIQSQIDSIKSNEV